MTKCASHLGEEGVLSFSTIAIIRSHSYVVDLVDRAEPDLDVQELELRGHPVNAAHSPALPLPLTTSLSSLVHLLKPVSYHDCSQTTTSKA